MLAPLRSEADFEKFKGHLNDKIVLIMDVKNVEMSTEPLAHRFTDEELFTRAKGPDPARLGTPDPRLASSVKPPQHFARSAISFSGTKARWWSAIWHERRRWHGICGSRWIARRERSDSAATVALTPEHYNRIARLIAHNIPVKLEFDVESEMIKDATDSFNVVGRNSWQCQEGRISDAGRSSRFVARGDGRDR